MKTTYYLSVCVLLIAVQRDLNAQELFDDFLGSSVNTTHWTVANTVWGNISGRRTNGGVVPQNVRVADGNLIIEAHGNNYTGPVAGHGQNTRVGGAITSKRRFASGRYEIRAKIVPHPGALSAFWTYYYENDNYNHEIDFEMPGNNQPPNGPANSNLNYGLMTSWRGVNTGQYHTTDKFFGNQADGNYHLYRFEWHTGGNGQTTRVEWYYDNQLMQTTNNPAYVPNHEGNFWMGVWFPWWIAEPNFNIAYLYVDWVRITPFLQPNDVPAPSGCSTAPAQPGLIVGNTSVPAGSSQTYYVDNVPGATSYNWILPSGWSGSSTTNAITATVGSAGGNISVRANNACGSSTYRAISVTVGSSPPNLALNKTATASSVETAAFPPSYAVDASMSTRWSSGYTSPQWLRVDLGATHNINRVKITWEAAYGRNYRIEVSSNGSTWQSIRTVTNNTSLVNDLTGLIGTGRYIRMYGTASGLAGYGYSIFNFEVYGAAAGGSSNSIASEAELIYSELDNKLHVSPNPAKSEINIQVVVDEPGFSTIDILDKDGKVMGDVLRRHLESGTYNLKYDASNLTSGGYFIRFQQQNAREVKRMIKIE